MSHTQAEYMAKRVKGVGWLIYQLMHKCRLEFTTLNNFTNSRTSIRSLKVSVSSSIRKESIIKLVTLYIFQYIEL